MTIYVGECEHCGHGPRRLKQVLGGDGFWVHACRTCRREYWGWVAPWKRRYRALCDRVREMIRGDQ